MKNFLLVVVFVITSSLSFGMHDTMAKINSSKAIFCCIGFSIDDTIPQVQAVDFLVTARGIGNLRFAGGHFFKKKDLSMLMEAVNMLDFWYVYMSPDKEKAKKIRPRKRLRRELETIRIYGYDTIKGDGNSTSDFINQSLKRYPKTVIEPGRMTKVINRGRFFWRIDKDFKNY